jgi:ABC-type multidrug transport system ATPase subunit
VIANNRFIKDEDPRDYTVFVDSLKKVYDNGKLAVNSISFASKQGEVTIYL